MKTREEKTEYKREWSRKNLARLRATQKAWRDRNRERLRGYWKHNTAKWRLNNLERWRENQRSNFRLRKYGITRLQFAALFEAQGKCCAVCKSDVPGGKHHWALDHCHATEKIRGILCHRCNLMLGHAKDDIRLLKRAIEYLRDGQ